MENKTNKTSSELSSAKRDSSKSSGGSKPGGSDKPVRSQSTSVVSKIDCATTNCQFLNNLYRNIQTATSSIDIVIDKVDDQDLAKELAMQKKSYDNISTQIATEITKCGELPKSNNIIKKAATWSGLQMSTLLNTKASHIADLMIQGSNTGILAVNKDKNLFDGCVEKESVNLADNLIQTYQKSIETLNSYL